MRHPSDPDEPGHGPDDRGGGVEQALDLVAHRALEGQPDAGGWVRGQSAERLRHAVTVPGTPLLVCGDDDH